MFLKMLNNNNNNCIPEDTSKRPLIYINVVVRSIIYVAILGLFTFSAECTAHISSSYNVNAIRTIPSQKIVLDNDPNHDLEPLPGAKDKLEKVRDYLHSQEIIEASKKSPMSIKNDYDFFKQPEYFGEDFLPLLTESFKEISEFFKNCLEKLKLCQPYL